METESTEDLEFVKLKIPQLIPRDLIEKIRRKNFTPEKFYDYQIKLVGNPYNHLYAMVDTSKKIQGYVWAHNDLLENALFVNSFYMTDKHWKEGERMAELLSFLHSLKESQKLERLVFKTTNKKFFFQKGFSDLKIYLMQYNDDKEAG